MAEEQPPDVAAANAGASEAAAAGPADAAPAAAVSPAAPPDPTPTAADSDPAAAAAAASPVSLDSFSIDELLSQASFDDPAIFGGASPAGMPDVPGPADGAAEFKLPALQQAMQDVQSSSIDLLRDVELNVKIELGRSRMLVEDVLKLSEGSVVELDKLAGDPVDVFVNDRLVARGEVLVLNDNFCVRVNEIVAGAKEEAM